MSDPEIMQMWKDQPSRGIVPSSEQIETRAAAAKTRARLEGRIAMAAALLNLAFAIAVPMYYEERSALRIAQFACWLVFLIYFRPHAHSRPLIIGLQLNSKAETCIDFYEKELDVQRRRYHGYRMGTAAFAVLGSACLLGLRYIHSGDPLSIMIAGYVLLIVSVLLAWQGWHQAPAIRREIEEFRNWKMQHQ